ncbi:MAG: hypothetical protein IKB96_03490, partial [Prevotella sp.]|nr:hypothetical protein [Prevotella sp.]
IIFYVFVFRFFNVGCKSSDLFEMVKDVWKKKLFGFMLSCIDEDSFVDFIFKVCSMGKTLRI